MTIAHIARLVYGRWLSRRLLPGIVAVLALAVVTGLMASIILIGIFYTAYLGLVHYGLDPFMAIFCVGAIAVLVTVICVLLLKQWMRRLRDIPVKAVKRSPLGAVGGTIDAFIEGLMHGEAHKS